MNQSSAHILIVDDDVGICFTLATLLRRQGYAVWTAADSVAADAWLHHRTFDLLILDIHLPGKVSGFDIAHRVRMYQPDVAVLILTGSDAFVNVIGNPRFAQFEIIFKTASPQNVLDRVAALLHQRQERYVLT